MRTEEVRKWEFTCPYCQAVSVFDPPVRMNWDWFIQGCAHTDVVNLRGTSDGRSMPTLRFIRRDETEVQGVEA